MQFKDQPDTFRVLNGSDVKHLDPEDHEEKKGKNGETIQAFWSVDKNFYEAEIIKIKGVFSKLVREGEGRGCQRHQNHSVVIYF